MNEENRSGEEINMKCYKNNLKPSLSLVVFQTKTKQKKMRIASPLKSSKEALKRLKHNMNGPVLLYSQRDLCDPVRKPGKNTLPVKMVRFLSP
jgi:hypothetical protein